MYELYRGFKEAGSGKENKTFFTRVVLVLVFATLGLAIYNFVSDKAYILPKLGANELGAYAGAILILFSDYVRAIYRLGLKSSSI